MIDFIAFVIAITVICILFAYSVVLKIKNRAIATQLFQALLDKSVVEDQLVQILSDKTIRDIEKSDGFLKFISESRDAAFQYIESVQSALIEYGNAIASNDPSEIDRTRALLFSFLPKSEDTNII